MVVLEQVMVMTVAVYRKLWTNWHQRRASSHVFHGIHGKAGCCNSGSSIASEQWEGLAGTHKAQAVKKELGMAKRPRGGGAEVPEESSNIVRPVLLSLEVEVAEGCTVAGVYQVMFLNGLSLHRYRSLQSSTGIWSLFGWQLL